MSWRRLRSVLRARPKTNFPEVQDFMDETENCEDTAIPIKIEEHWHESPSEPSLGALRDGSHVYEIRQQYFHSDFLLSVPNEPHKLRRTSSLGSKPQYFSGSRSPSINSINTLSGNGWRSQLSLTGSGRSPKPVREIFYRESREDLSCLPVELSSLSQV